MAGCVLSLIRGGALWHGRLWHGRLARGRNGLITVSWTMVQIPVSLRGFSQSLTTWCGNVFSPRARRPCHESPPKRMSPRPPIRGFVGRGLRTPDFRRAGTL